MQPDFIHCFEVLSRRIVLLLLHLAGQIQLTPSIEKIYYETNGKALFLSNYHILITITSIFFLCYFTAFYWRVAISKKKRYLSVDGSIFSVVILF